MNWLGRIFGRRRIYGELSAEIRAHLDEKVEELVAGGMPREEAEHAARREFGNVMLAEQRSREVWRWSTLENVWMDVRYGLRMLRKSPAFAAVAILTLALGIGASTATFSLLDALFLRPLPVPHPEQLVRFGLSNPQDFTPSDLWLSLPMFRHFSRDQKVFSSTFAWSSDAVLNVQARDTLSLADVWWVSGNYYSELGATPQLGRLIGPGDVDLQTDTPSQVVVLSYGFWRRMYGGARDVVGKTLTIEGVPFTIIGVSRKGFQGTGGVLWDEVVLPLTTEPLVLGEADVRKHLERPDAMWLEAEGRLKPGVSLSQARAQLESLWPGVREAIRPARQTPTERTYFYSRRFSVSSGARGGSLLESRFGKPIYLLLAISGLLLLVACVNLAGLMLARAASRSHEFGVRVALGAGGGRLARQILTESVTLSAAGALLGMALASLASGTLADFIMTRIFTIPAELNLTPDPRVLGFTTAAAILTGILFGIAPAWRATQADPSISLQRGARTLGRGAGSLGQSLIVTQAAVSLVLIVGAGLFLRTVAKLHSVQPGFRNHGLLHAYLTPVPNGYKNLDMVSYYRELSERVSSLPGVESAGFSHMGLGSGFEWTERIGAVGGKGLGFEADVGMGLPGFFHTAGIALLRGRSFTWRDDPHAPHVALVSARLAKALFPRGDAIGQRVQLLTEPKWQPVEIVGIASDASIYDIRKTGPPTLYLPSTQYGDYAGWSELYVETAANPLALAGTVKTTVASLGHEYVRKVSTIDEDINRSLLSERITAMLATFFAGLALLMAAIGLYGLMAYSVARRAREFGLRRALGAQRATIGKMVMGEAVKLIAAGLVIGLACAAGATRLVAHMLFGLSPYDPATMLLAACVLIAAGALAAYLPARRAMRVDPAIALREE